MKIRNGFVSNSSSSSFLIYGVYLEGVSELRNSIKDGILNEKFQDEDSDDYDDLYEMMEEIMENSDLEYHIHPDYDGVYIGKSWDSIGDDQTGREFKESIRKEIKEKFNVDDKDFNTLEESFYLF